VAFFMSGSRWGHNRPGKHDSICAEKWPYIYWIRHYVALVPTLISDNRWTVKTTRQSRPQDAALKDALIGLNAVFTSSLADRCIGGGL
jgi:hypothetical protein